MKNDIEKEKLRLSESNGKKIVKGEVLEGVIGDIEIGVYGVERKKGKTGRWGDGKGGSCGFVE